MRLRNKTAIVTGGANGIGRAISELFAAEGAHVFIADLDKAAGEETSADICKAGGHATFLHCDVANVEQVSRSVKAAADAKDHLDVLCNNAAYLSERWHNTVEALEDEWEKSFRVSLMGTQHFTREVLPLMIRTKAGSIINVSSVQGLVAG